MYTTHLGAASSESDYVEILPAVSFSGSQPVLLQPKIIIKVKFILMFNNFRDLRRMVN